MKLVHLLVVVLFAGLASAAEEGYTLVDRIDDFFKVATNVISIPFDEVRPMEEEVTFFCTNRLQQPALTQVSVSDVDISNKVNRNLPVLLVIHGWLESKNVRWINNVITNYLDSFDGNVCVVDWERFAQFTLTMSCMKTDPVGQYVAQWIDSNGIPHDQVTIVGHSMGAHVAGVAGHHTSSQLDQIIGLDASGACFDLITDNTKTLDKSDASWVQNIHTDSSVLGSFKRRAHQNFIANGGVLQPGCLVSIFNPNEMTLTAFECNHFRAPQYFNASLVAANVFKGRRCGFSLFGICLSYNLEDRFGLFNERKGEGDFAVTITSSSYPYV